ncbi:putative Mitochondrial uncoupling protein [Fasciolopsis buskii]|uniref:Putative Mitochondrial uncoupling protein n=1 Tax=Fasciolopsis buskii TaxID=27845 RepID=A0A8E0VLW4_9TREM|nr:putative Mitochondrial uncoupling protein [Fasciolopsis buski]
MTDHQPSGFFETFRRKYPSGLALCMCCASAFVAETATYPLDMLKTRVQVFGMQQSRRSHPGILRLGAAIIRSEGILQLWQGLSPALLRHLIYTGSRVPIYEFIRRDVFHLPPAAHFTVKRRTDELSGSTTVSSSSEYDGAGERDWRFVLRAATAGMVAGGTAQFLASPTDLMKVR